MAIDPLTANEAAIANPNAGDDRLDRLGAWMVLLVTARLAPAVATWLVHAFGLLQAGRSMLLDPPALDDLVGLALLGWPLLLGLVVWWRGWPHLARASAIAFLALTLDRALAIAVDIGLGHGLPFEARYRLPVAPRLRSPAAFNAWIAGLLAFEFLIASRARRIDRAFRRHRVAGNGPTGRRRAILGRLAAVGSIVFAATAVGLAAWDGYLKALQVLPSVRRMVLETADPVRAGPRFQAGRPESPLAIRAREHLLEADLASVDGRHRQAKAAYFQAIQLFERLLKESPRRGGYRRELALVYNNVAWLLATCPDAEVRLPRRSVELARKAVAINPNDGNAWNTLGVAHFRDGDHAAATRALERSMELRDGGDSFDWFFLAMIRADGGDFPEARRLHEQALAWRLTNRRQDPELRRFAIEATEALGLALPPDLLGPPPEPSRRPPFVSTGELRRRRAGSWRFDR